MLHEQRQTISMRSNVREWTHVLLMNTPCSHLHSFLSNWREQRPSNKGDLDSSVTEGGGVQSLLNGGEPASDLIFVP
jgi:hypothetical protein